MSSHTLEGKKKTQNGVKRLMFTVLSILLEVVFLIGIFKGLNEYAVFIDNLTRIFAVILVLKIYGRNETSIYFQNQYDGKYSGSENIWKK